MKPTGNELKPYKGLLSPKEVAAGMNAAIKNGNRLAEDAHLLLENDRVATAASVAALSIEESGKVAILRQIAISTSEKEAITAWKSYRKHTDKNRLWIFPQLLIRQLNSYAAAY